MRALSFGKRLLPDGNVCGPAELLVLHFQSAMRLVSDKQQNTIGGGHVL